MFNPAKGESYLARTDFAEWLYTYHPQWYDPEPEVLIERALGSEMPEAHWAYSGSQRCTKLLLVGPVQDPGIFTNPPGCITPNDARAIFDAVVRGELKPNPRGYINLTY
ncbi:MAG: hypothetical protein WKF37_05345 [Bryobacteraceae bacterium]